MCFVMGPAMSASFGDNAGTFMNMVCFGTPLVAVFSSSWFGRWIDRNDKRLAMSLVIKGTAGPFLTLWWPNKYGFYAFLVLCWASGPFEMQVSGNPANWALASEIIEPEKRELGFALLGACTAMVGLLWARFVFTSRHAPTQCCARTSSGL